MAQVDSHDRTEDTWVVYDWLALDELWTNVTVTLTLIRSAGCPVGGGGGKIITVDPH